MCHCPPGDRASVWRNPAGTCQHPTLTPMLLAAGGHSEGLSRRAPDNPSARHGTETEWPPSPAHAADLEAAPVPRAAAPAHRPGRATGPTPSQQSPWSSLLCPRGRACGQGGVRRPPGAPRPCPCSVTHAHTLYTCTHMHPMHSCKQTHTYPTGGVKHTDTNACAAHTWTCAAWLRPLRTGRGAAGQLGLNPDCPSSQEPPSGHGPCLVPVTAGHSDPDPTHWHESLCPTRMSCLGVR